MTDIFSKDAIWIGIFCISFFYKVSKLYIIKIFYMIEMILDINNWNDIKIPFTVIDKKNPNV